MVMPDDSAVPLQLSALKDRHGTVGVNWIDPDSSWGKTAASCKRRDTHAGHSPRAVITSRRWVRWLYQSGAADTPRRAMAD